MTRFGYIVGRGIQNRERSDRVAFEGTAFKARRDRQYKMSLLEKHELPYDLRHIWK